jgi:rRNA maturation endonuclease Nob1
MEGLLCKKCFDEKELNFNKMKDFCSVCGNKLGLFRHNPKNSWKIKGQLCRNCWDTAKTQHEK